MTTPLSPAAQAVMAAANAQYCDEVERVVAAALRAAAAQIIEDVEPVESLIAIANELDPQPLPAGDATSNKQPISAQAPKKPEFPPPRLICEDFLPRKTAEADRAERGEG